MASTEKNRRYYQQHREQIRQRERRRYKAIKNRTYTPKPKYSKEAVAKHTIELDVELTSEDLAEMGTWLT